MQRTKRIEPTEEWIVNKAVVKTIVGMVGASLVMNYLQPAIDQLSQKTEPFVVLLLGIGMLAWAVKKERRGRW